MNDPNANADAQPPLSRHDCSAWSSSPPDSEGFWWLYGDEEFGTMGGNYSGSIPPSEELQIVNVRRLGDGLMGVSGGRMIALAPFDAAGRKPGYIGVWQKVALPTLPNVQVTNSAPTTT